MKIRKQKQRWVRKTIEEPYRINEKITALTVRIVGENIESKICSVQEARAIAQQQDSDLVEISPKADPPVCKVINYSKFKYEQKKKQEAMKAKSCKTTLKEIRFGPNTGEHDFEFKRKHAIKFLQEKAKVKVFMHFGGRSIAFKDRGEVLLLRFAQALEAYSKVEALPKMEGRRMILTLLPKNK